MEAIAPALSEWMFYWERLGLGMLAATILATTLSNLIPP